MWWNVIADALLDTLKLFPFLFLLYILIELMEHKTRVGKPSRALSGKCAPLLGAAAGLLPMCGFSVMAAKLYRHRHLTLGALFAVFIATSDEALLVLLLSGADWAVKGYTLLALLGCKFVFAIGVGYLTDAIVRHPPVPIPTHSHEEHAHEEHSHEEHSHEEHEHEHSHEGEEDEEACACAELRACEHKHETAFTRYFVSPVVHALEVAGFVLLCNLLFGFLFYALGGGNSTAGEEAVAGFMQGAGYWYQPLVCSLIGLIPNCASSVVLAETYALGGIGFGGLFGGLVVNTGLGLFALFRKEDWKSGLGIAAVMLLLGVAAGYVASAFAILI